jgi:hypothetical protein
MVTNLGKFFTDSINYVDQSFTDFDFIVCTSIVMFIICNWMLSDVAWFACFYNSSKTK